MGKVTFSRLQDVVNNLSSTKNYQIILQTNLNSNFYTLLFLKGSYHYKIEINAFDLDDSVKLNDKINKGAKEFERKLMQVGNI